MEADCGEVALEEGDILLLCSDGLTNYVSVDDIACVLAQTPFYKAADVLIEKALEGGGLDNVTVLLIGAQAEEGENG